MKDKIIAVVALAAAFLGGYQFAAALYGEDIATLKEDYATRSQALEEKYRAKEQSTIQKLSEAWALRDAALGHIDDLSGELERVRLEADAAAVECPQPAPLPAALSESSLPDAQTLSSEAQTWFAEVSSFLSELR